MKALRLDSCRTSILLSASESSLMLLMLSISWCMLKCLRKASIYRSLGWVSDMRQSLVGDMCHSLIGGALRLFLQDTWHLLIGRNVFIFKVTHVSTQLDFLCHRLHAQGCLCLCLHMLMHDWFLNAFYAPISTTLVKFLLVFE